MSELSEELDAALAEFSDRRAELAEARLIARWAVEQMPESLGKQVGAAIVAKWDAEESDGST